MQFHFFFVRPRDMSARHWFLDFYRLKGWYGSVYIARVLGVSLMVITAPTEVE